MRKDGQHEIKATNPVTGKRESFYSSLSKEDARRKAREKFNPPPNATTLGWYFQEVYWPTVEQRSYNWKEQIAWAMDGYVLPDFGNRPIEAVTRAEWQAHFNRIAASKKVKPSSLRKVKIVLSGIYNLAEADEMVTRNPVRHVRLAPSNEPDKRALTFEELGALLEVESVIKPFVILAGCCGLRLGEALAVQRNHIENGVLHVCQQVLQPKGGCVISPTLKTPQSDRRVPLPASLVESLLGCGQKSAVFVCSDTMGGYLTPNNATRELHLAWAKAEIGRITPHELRHTFISLMENELEAPRPTVEELSGKSKGKGLGVYSKAAMARKLAWMQKYWDGCRSATTKTAEETRTETA